MNEQDALQKELCKSLDIDWVESPENMKVGISLSALDGKMPINGLRHNIEGETTGWYIWGGEEFSSDPDFFKPLHVKHLKEKCPQIIKFLGLPPGYRFLTDGKYEDVWEDLTLLNR